MTAKESKLLELCEAEKIAIDALEKFTKAIDQNYKKLISKGVKNKTK